MKTLKLLLLVNDCNWSSLESKVADLTNWFKVPVKIDVVRSHYYNIPFSDYNTVRDQYNKSLSSTNLKGIDPTWYDENVSKRAIGYDMVLFVCNEEEWKAPTVRGWRTDSNFGPIEMQVLGIENDVSMNGTMTANSFLSECKHELSHALYMLAGAPDRTHEFYYGGDLYLNKIWGDIKFKEPNQVDKFSLRAKIAWILFSIFKPGILEADVRIGIMSSAIQRHEGWYPGSKSFRNSNPGNLLFANQEGTIGKDKTGFAIFKYYQFGWNALNLLIKRGALGLSSVYFPWMKLWNPNWDPKKPISKQNCPGFFDRYAPSFENDTQRYAEYVADEMGVDLNTFVIGDLMK